jgi:hypothetical protein
MSATVIDVSQLLDVGATALAAGVGVPVLFSLAVLGADRAAAHRREHSAAALAYGALTTACLAACMAAVVFGVLLLTRK